MISLAVRIKKFKPNRDLMNRLQIAILKPLFIYFTNFRKLKTIRNETNLLNNDWICDMNWEIGKR